MIKTIIFDLDDTLYRELDFVYGAFREVCKYLSYKYNKDVEQLYQDTIYILDEFGRGKVFDMICNKNGIKEDIDFLVKLYREAMPPLKLYEDAEHILREFKGEGSKLLLNEEQTSYNIGIITDGKSSVQWNKIKALDLENRVDKIMVTDDYGLDFWKPNEFSYREMLKYFNSMPEECIYVGDNPNKDFIGARKVGMHTVRIIREVGDHMKTFLDKDYEGDFIIKDLKELKCIIKLY